MKPSTQLDRDTIIRAGHRIAAEPGSTGVSFRDLGRVLGVDHTAMYRHVRNKDELMRLLLDDLIQGAVDSVTADVTEWQDQLSEFAHGILQTFIAHPAIGAEAVVLTTYGNGELNAMELMLRAFEQAGLKGDRLVEYYGLFSSYTLSRAAGIARSRAARKVPLGERVPWMDAPVRSRPEHVRVERYRTEILSLVDDELFEHGMKLIIESAEGAGSEE